MRAYRLRSLNDPSCPFHLFSLFFFFLAKYCHSTFEIGPTVLGEAARKGDKMSVVFRRSGTVGSRSSRGERHWVVGSRGGELREL